MTHSSKVILLSCIFALILSGNGFILPEIQESKIIGGVPVPITDAPYTVALLANSPETQGYVFRCGGIIITPLAILTSANCLYEIWPTHIWVRAGSANRTSGGQLVQAFSSKYHEEFRWITLENDIGVIRLATQLALGPTVSTVTLPAQGLTIPDGTVCSFTGWGRLGVGGVVPEELRQVALPIVNQTICENAYISINPVPSTMICAGNFTNGGVGACEGDAGGPLVNNGIVYGISSWGVSCGNVGNPSVFTRVSSFRNWIVAEAKMNDLNIE